MRIAIAADTHIGANKFGVSAEKWNAPVVELVEYAIENKLDAVAIAGDVFHHRKPSPAAQQFMYDQIGHLKENKIVFFGADGNHDDEVREDSVSATWAFMEALQWARKTVSRLTGGKVNIVLLPWVTPQAYEVSEGTVETQNELTQAIVLDRISSLIRSDMPNVLIGHAMVSYAGGTELAPSPGLQWAGKDVVFDYDALTANFDAVFLGHVHDPNQKGYVGSSQPTDWGDAGQAKRFVVIDTDDMTTVGEIPYKTSLKLLDADPSTVIDDISKVRYNVARYRQHAPAGSEPSPEAIAEIRQKLSLVADKVESVEITVERVVAQRVAGGSLAAMPPTDAVDAYLRHTSVDPQRAKSIKAKFGEVLEHSKS